MSTVLSPPAVQVRTPTEAPRRTWVRLGREGVLIAVLLLAYDAARLLRRRARGVADDNARQLLRVEHWLHLPREQDLQSALLHSSSLTRIANTYYADVHFPLTFLALGWLFLRRPGVYTRTRRALVLATAVALAVYLLVPVAPPRMFPQLGFVDTGAKFGQSVYSGSRASVSNQLAAMPSLHVGWALLIAVAMISASTTRWRWLWLLHPTATFVVVVITGNHYYLDGIVGAALTLTTFIIYANYDHGAVSPGPGLGSPPSSHRPPLRSAP